MRTFPNALIMGVLAMLISAHGHAAIVVDDSSRGMTCHYVSAAAKLSWQRPGGDWTDADDKPFGSKPIASQTITKSKGNQRVEWDVTGMVRSWTTGKSPVGALYLKAIDPGATVNFVSRESKTSPLHPTLLVEWDDGKKVGIRPDADTYFSCPNHKSYGNKSILKVGGKHSAILVFPFENRESHEVRNAKLLLTSNKQYGRGASIGVFRPMLPGGGPAPVQRGIAEHHIFDKGIEEHSAVYLAERFDSQERYAEWAGERVEKTGEIITSDPSNGFEPWDGGAVRVTIRKGQNVGMNTHFRFARQTGTEPEEAFFRYQLRLGENWEPLVVGGKLPGFSGTYGRAGWGKRRSNGHNGWSARGAFFRQARSGATTGLQGIGSYVYHAGMDSTSGDRWGWNRGPTGILEKNRWYSIEQQLQLNSPGRNDGVLRAWIDGQLVFDRRDINFRDTKDLKIESLWLNVYHGGMTRAAKDLTLYIDNLVIARDYIGPVRTSKRPPSAQ